MKYIYKIILFISVIAFFNSCDNGEGLNEGKFNVNPETGWVEFLNSVTSLQSSLSGVDLSEPLILALPIAVNVPVNKSDLQINYSLQGVAGPDPNTIFSNNGIVIAEAGKSSTFGQYYPEIEIDLTEASSIQDIMVFDVVLNSTNNGNVSAGITGADSRTSVRIEICPALDGFAGTYAVDEVFTSGGFAGVSLAGAFGESYQVELTPQSGDTTGTKFVINNSAGFNTYFLNGTVMTLDKCGEGALSFDDGFTPDIPVIALFREFAYTSTSSTFGNYTITCSGPLDTFGEYVFVLTKI